MIDLSQMKRKRAWWFIGGFLLLCGLFLYLFIALGEHRDYIRGAEGLEEARARAREVIGELTWDEYREKHGYQAADDKEEWLTLEASIPPMFEEYELSFLEGPPLCAVEELYLQNRDWLFSLAEQIEPLRLTRPTARDELNVPFGADYIAGREIAKVMCNLLLGAADAGDVEGVREAGRITWMIVERQLEETDVGSWMIAESLAFRAEREIVEAAVRNRHNKEVVTVLLEVFAQRPQLPSKADTLIGEMRTYMPIVREMQGKKPGELDQALDRWFGSNPEYPDSGKIDAWVRQALKKLNKDETPVSNRQTGSRTMDALEARYYEVFLKCYEASLDLPYTSSNAHKEMQELTDLLDSYTDRSYELASIFHYPGGVEFHNSELVQQDTPAIALELVARYPDYENLPDELPDDLVHPDAFGGEPLLYKKTPYGFVVYSRFENRVDDGFPADPELLQRQALFTRTWPQLDTGFIVAYKALDPVP